MIGARTRLCAAAVLALFCVGCTNATPTRVVSPVVRGAAAPSPKSVVLFVDAREMNDPNPAIGAECVIHTYPIRAEGDFTQSALQAVSSVFEQVDLRSGPLAPNAAAGGAADYVIGVEVDDLDVEVRMVSVILASARADAEIELRVTVDGPSGRVANFDVEESGSKEGGAFFGCHQFDDLIGEAITKAMEKALARLAGELRSLPPD